MGAAPGETSRGISPWDDAPPRRPALPDVNNAALQNRADAMPDPTRFPTANLLNGEAYMALSIGKVMPNAVISVKYTGGNPVINYGASACGVSQNGVQDAVTSGAVQIERTPGALGGAASGDVVIWAPALTFPAPVSDPKVYPGGAVPFAFAAEWFTDTVNNRVGIRVVTQTLGGVATDFPFTVDWM